MEYREKNITLEECITLAGELFGTDTHEPVMMAKMNGLLRHPLLDISEQVEKEVARYKSVENAYIKDNGTIIDGKPFVVKYETFLDEKGNRKPKLDAAGGLILTPEGEAFEKEMGEVKKAIVTLKIPNQLTVELLEKIEIRGSMKILYKIIEK